MKRYLINSLLLLFVFSVTASAQTTLDSDQPVSIKNALSGWSTSIDGNWALITSPQKDNGTSVSIGEVSFMQYADDRWNLRQIVQPAGLPVLSNFGYSADLFSETAAIGSIGNNESADHSGAVYLYKLNGDVWQHQTTLQSEQVKDGNRFGSSVDLHQNVLAVGAPMGDGNESKTGKVILFEQLDGSWNETAALIAEDGENGDFFGQTVHIINNAMIAVGAYKANGSEPESGAVYIFEREGQEWTQTGKIIAPSGKPYDVFGYSLDSHSTEEFQSQAEALLFIGAPGTDHMGGQTGSVFAFKKSEGAWSLVSQISQEDPAENAHFGVSISANNIGDLLVGASRVNSADRKEMGMVYAYRIQVEEDGFIFNSDIRIDFQSEQNFSHFGAQVSSSDEFIIVSSPYDDRNGLSNSGSVFFYGATAVSNEEVTQTVDSFGLFQNYPNPFNPSTVISYQLPVNSEVSLRVFDMLGREVATLVDRETKAAGAYNVTFDAGNLASGMYVYRLQAGEMVLTKKLTLIK